MARSILINLAAQEKSSRRQARIYGRAAELLETELAKATDRLETDIYEAEAYRLRALEDELNADAECIKAEADGYIAQQIARIEPTIGGSE